MLEMSKPLLWQQFGAAIDMLENAIVACPDQVWTTNQREFDFWYNAFHTIFWLDFYLSDSRESFVPTQPYGVTEFDPSGLLPERVFTRTELLAYLEQAREKCRQRIQSTPRADANLQHGHSRIYASRAAALQPAPRSAPRRAVESTLAATHR